MTIQELVSADVVYSFMKVSENLHCAFTYSAFSPVTWRHNGLGEIAIKGCSNMNGSLDEFGQLDAQK